MTDRERAENTRGKWERTSDRTEPLTTAQAAYRFANDHGPVALIAVAAIGFMAYLWMTSLSSIQNDVRGQGSDLRTHIHDTLWLQRQQCISLAVMSGTPKELCDPPVSR